MSWGIVLSAGVSKAFPMLAISSLWVLMFKGAYLRNYAAFFRKNFIYI